LVIKNNCELAHGNAIDNPNGLASACMATI
jgi:hypothetical protein